MLASSVVIFDAKYRKLHLTQKTSFYDSYAVPYYSNAPVVHVLMTTCTPRYESLLPIFETREALWSPPPDLEWKFEGEGRRSNKEERKTKLIGAMAAAAEETQKMVFFLLMRNCFLERQPASAPSFNGEGGLLGRR